MAEFILIRDDKWIITDVVRHRSRIFGDTWKAEAVEGHEAMIFKYMSGAVNKARSIGCDVWAVKDGQLDAKVWKFKGGLTNEFDRNEHGKPGV